ncbi:MAG TPA: glucosamine-6-phosphate deaminase [Bacillus sp. (in: firmicutes)]|uniref:glucosamine-6-phosphate deaminase n=1 Tax=Bacillus litorisediminis TaxID=2922713 RepID=UPI0028BF0870|nr:glucosamine-6-phosphate deaminase [Bacillus litorisediminis]HWO76650.1 glucosamine-6-phosphate deaminase [Bacillus sp. (in: firmicutes)]
MRIIACKDYQEMSQTAAKEIISLVKKRTPCTLGLATGSTPEGVYRELVHDFQQGQTSYSHVTSVNLDEYVGLLQSDRNSYHYYMQSKLFQYIDLPRNQQLIPDGTAKDLEAECKNYEEKIVKAGGVDLQILGIGHNGHIGFNEPGTSFLSRTHVVELAEKTRKANARFFSSMDDVPAKAITMGIATIMESKRILLLVSGQSKADTIARLLDGTVDESFPASILNLHDDVTVIADEEALSAINQNEIRKSYSIG